MLRTIKENIKIRLLATLALTIVHTHLLFAGTDIGIISIAHPNGTICQPPSGIYPNVALKNFGTDTLLSCAINYRIDNDPVQTYNWNGSLLPNQTANVTLYYINTFGGSKHTFICYPGNPNNSSDTNPANDTSISRFFYSYGNIMSQNFDSSMSLFPPEGWQIINYDGSITWDARYTDTLHNHSIYMDNFHYNKSAKGQVDEIISPPVVLGTYPELYFSYAHKKYTDPASNPVYLDTLDLLLSADCGNTWTSIWKKYADQLVTATPPFDTSEFVPKSSDWAHVFYGPLLMQWSGQSVLFKFRYTTDCENNLYIDDFVVTFYFGVDERNFKHSIEIFPNPCSARSNLRTEIILKNATLTIHNSFGDMVKQVNNLYGQSFVFDRENLPSGLYCVQLTTDSKVYTDKLIITDR